MSFYSMMFGQNPRSDILLAVLGIRKVDVPRFRDVYVSDDGSEITIYTRSGGGNRQEYGEENAALGKLPGFKRDYDDDYDCTYANFEYEVPEEWRSDVANCSDILGNGLRKEFCQMIAATLQREPTEKDLSNRAFEAERASLNRQPHFMANGHTYVPKTDTAMEEALKLAEENDGSLRSCWGIAPIVLHARQDVVEWPNSKKTDDEQTLSRAVISYDMNWAMDQDYWERCKRKFGESYPKAMAKIQETVDRYATKEPKFPRAESAEVVALREELKSLSRERDLLQSKLNRIRSAVD